MFTIEQLAGFVAVAEELHFGRAAERLNMTQPPLSRQIQKLEKTVGVELLIRNNRKVELTSAGAGFLEDARRLLALVQRAPLTAQRVAAGHTGLLRIGFTAASSFSILGPVLEEIAETIPEVDIDLREMVTGEQLAGLGSGELDLGIGRPPFDQDLFASRLLYREGLVLAVPVGHRLAQLHRDISPSDFKDEPIIMHSPTEARYFYDLVVKMLPLHHGNVVHTVSQILTMVCLVAAKRGVAFVPQSTALLGVAGVQFLPLESQQGDPVELHAIWSRGSTNPALTRLLGSLMQ